MSGEYPPPPVYPEPEPSKHQTEFQRLIEHEPVRELPQHKTMVFRDGATAWHTLGPIKTSGTELIAVNQETPSFYVGSFEDLGYMDVYFRREDCQEYISSTEEKAREKTLPTTPELELLDPIKVESPYLQASFDLIRENQAEVLANLDELKAGLELAARPYNIDPEEVPDRFICGLAAAAMTEALKKTGRGETTAVNTVYGYCPADIPEGAMQHYWTEINDSSTGETFTICPTYRLLNPNFGNQILICSTQEAEQLFGFCKYNPTDYNKENFKDQNDQSTWQLLQENGGNFPARDYLRDKYSRSKYKPRIIGSYNEIVGSLVHPL